MQQEHRVQQLVRKIVYRTLGRQPGSAAVSSLITESALQQVEPGSSFAIPEGALVTPLARQLAMDRRITLTGNSAPMPSLPGKTVAIGADHGGVELKAVLKTMIAEQGMSVMDCGSEGSESVDYPDYALAVARLVSEGQAWRGIVIDGAGIGSSMAANKVPGVLAALCYDQATAVNSREHNNVNVLTLGAGMIGPNLAKQIVRSWLSTPFAGGRHQRRVDKIRTIEKRYSK